VSPVTDNILPQLVAELICSQDQLATAIAAADTGKMTEILDEREPVWQELKELLDIPGMLAGSTRSVLEKLMQRENRLQEQLQQEMSLVDDQALELDNRSRVLRRYRLPLKPQPRFLDRNG